MGCGSGRPEAPLPITVSSIINQKSAAEQREAKSQPREARERERVRERGPQRKERGQSGSEENGGAKKVIATRAAAIG